MSRRGEQTVWLESAAERYRQGGGGDGTVGGVRREMVSEEVARGISHGLGVPDADEVLK